MTSSEALAIVKQDDAQTKALNAARYRLPEILAEIEAREEAVTRKETRCCALEPEIAAKESRLRELEASIKQAEQKQAGLRATLERETAREREKMFSALDTEAAPVRAQLEAVRRELAEKQAVLAQLRA